LIEASRARIDNTIFKDNHAGQSGGGIRLSSGTLFVTDSEFTGNTADDDGGGIFVSAIGELLEVGLTFSENTPDDIFHEPI
jgi:predicted outer membrane repeat protein